MNKIFSFSFCMLFLSFDVFADIHSNLGDNQMRVLVQDGSNSKMTQALDFKAINIKNHSAGNVTMNPVNGMISSDNNNLIVSNVGDTGILTIQSSPYRSVYILLPKNAKLKNTNGSDELVLSNFTTDIPLSDKGTVITKSDGYLDLKTGASLNIPKNVSDGNYVGSYILGVNY